MNTCIYNGIRFAQGKGSFMLATWVLLALTGFETALAQTYTVTDLGTLGGGNSSRAFGINNFGQLVGTAWNGEFYTLRSCQFYCADLGCTRLRWVCDNNSYAKQRAFLWTPSRPGGTSGTMIDLGTLGGPNANPVNLSQSGSVVGDSNTQHVRTYGGKDVGSSHEFYDNHGFLWTPEQPNSTRGSMSDLESFIPRAINSSGQMVGGRFLRQGAVTTDLGAVNARSINDLGQVVGGSLIVSNGHSHAFLWQNGILSDLGTLPGYANSDAYDINTNGQVIVECYNESGGYQSSRGFLFALDSSGSVTSRVDLGTLPSPYYYWHIAPRSINNRGEVVGYGYSQSAGIWWAFLWDIAHGVRNLNALIPTNSGWFLFEACGINDHGQIAASRTYYGQYGAVLLTPLPAPRLTFAATQPNGQFRFTLIGEPGRTYTIQASTNLVNWTALTNFVSATGTNQFTDSAAPNFSRRFYRAVTP